MGRLLRLTDIDTPISRGSVPRAGLDHAPLGIHGPFWAKAWQLAKVAAKEGADDRIRVNTVLPGGVKTPIWRAVPMFQDLWPRRAARRPPSTRWPGWRR